MELRKAWLNCTRLYAFYLPASFLRASVFLLFAALWLPRLCAQPRSVKFDRYSSAGGLSENNVHCIFRDSRGFVWLGTDDGLNRFDGYSFQIYRPNTSGQRNLPGNRLRCIAETQSGDILAGFEKNGLCLIDRATEQVRRFHIVSGTASVADYTVYDLCAKGDGTIWAATDMGLMLLDPYLGFIDSLAIGDLGSGGISQSNVTRMYYSRAGFLWLARSNGTLDKHDPLAGRTQSLSLGKYPGTSISEDQQGNIWVGTLGGGLIKIPPSGRMRHFRPNPETVGAISDSIIAHGGIAADEFGRLWIGTANKGLNEMPLHTARGRDYFFIKHRSKQADELSIADDAILCVYYDSGGILWVGHRGGGFSKVNLYPKKFHNFLLNTQGFISKNVQAISHLSNGDILVGTQTNGILVYNSSTNAYRQILSGKSGASGGLPSPNVTAMAQDARGRVWVGTMGGGLAVLDIAAGTSQWCVSGQACRWDARNIAALAIDRYGTVWASPGTEGGLFFLPSGRRQFAEAQVLGHAQGTLQVSHIFSDRDGLVWLCTKMHGVFYFKPSPGGQITDLVHLPYLPGASPMPHFTAHHICQAPDGRHWIATGGGGVLVYDIATGQHQLIGQEQGMPSGVVRALAADNTGKMWASTHKGIVSYNLADGRLNIFAREDGLMTENFIAAAAATDRAGRIFFGADIGMVGFRPDQITLSYDVPKVVLTELRIFNTPVEKLPSAARRKQLMGPLDAKSEIKLSYKDYVFSIEFAAVEHNTPGKCEYQYMLEGFDDQWIHTTATSRVATYTNLRKGSYIFKVRASNGDGVWSKQPTVIKVKIAPPFWETRWFMLAAAAMLVGAAGAWLWFRDSRYASRQQALEALIDARTKEVRLQKEKLIAQTMRLQQADATKNKFFSIIAHDLKNPFNAFIGFTSMLRDNFKNYPEQRKLQILDIVVGSAQTMYQLLDNLLSWARSQSGSIEYVPGNIQLSEQLQTSIVLLSAAAGEKNIAVNNFVHRDIIVWADMNLLDACIRNVLSNAVKFSKPEGRIDISAKLAHGHVVLCVQDYGIGIAKQKQEKLFRIDTYSSTLGTKGEEGTGLGLVVVNEFVQINGGRIWIESEPGIGTKVFMSFPADGSHNS
jgi:signal transduction histidine kinase/ligand-binding sensor domain-containing protein